MGEEGKVAESDLPVSALTGRSMVGTPGGILYKGPHT